MSSKRNFQYLLYIFVVSVLFTGIYYLWVVQQRTWGSVDFSVNRNKLCDIQERVVELKNIEEDALSRAQEEVDLQNQEVTFQNYLQ